LIWPRTAVGLGLAVGHLVLLKADKCILVTMTYLHLFHLFLCIWGGGNGPWIAVNGHSKMATCYLILEIIHLFFSCSGESNMNIIK